MYVIARMKVEKVCSITPFTVYAFVCLSFFLHHNMKSIDKKLTWQH